ncbi:Polymer-forming protein [Lachnospiraceae bacterium]|nr:Polymer-forming protein [Lachnospiraceae bacterium]
MGFFSDFKEDLTQAVDGFSAKQPVKEKDGALEQLSQVSEEELSVEAGSDDGFGTPVVDMNESAMDGPMSDSLMADQNEGAMDEPQSEAGEFDFDLSSLLSSVGVPVKDDETSETEQGESEPIEADEPSTEDKEELETIDIDPEISAANMTFEEQPAETVEQEVSSVDFSFGTDSLGEIPSDEEISVSEIYANAPAEESVEGEVSIEQVLTEERSEEVQTEEVLPMDFAVDAESVENTAEAGEDSFAGEVEADEEAVEQSEQPSENIIAGEDEIDMGETAEVLEEEIVTDGVDLSFTTEPEEVTVENIVEAEESIDMSDDQLKNLQIPELEEGEVADETGAITLGMKINGDITSEGNLDVLGTVNGNIHIRGKLNISGSVTGNSKASEIFADSAKITGEVISTGAVKVGQESVILGNITATSAVIAGAVKGDIDVHGPVILDTSAIVMGDIKSKSVQINNGAVIEGHCSQCYAEVSPTSFFDDLKSSIGERKK